MKHTPRESFVVRIWREKDQPGWRGWVQHPRSGEVVWVQRVSELLAFIERWAGSLDNTGSTGLK